MINKKNHRTILESLYSQALQELANNEFASKLDEINEGYVKNIIDRAEGNKGVYTVVLTLMAHKIFDPGQDIRLHQTQIPGGFAGRGKDFEYVTPFLKSVDFPAMSESGWLTRSLEQAVPYDLNYPGKITPKRLKDAFLQLIHNVQEKGLDPQDVVIELMKCLIIQRDKKDILLIRPSVKSINDIIRLFEQHFEYNYSCHGASRLPTLALYAAYQCMINQVARYKDKTLCPLESHTSADTQSGQIGDIQINNIDGSPYEGIEVKHRIKITPELVQHAYEKFIQYPTNRYYLLTTANMDSADWDGINQKINDIGKMHSCLIIVNGVYSTLNYYLRLLVDPTEVIDKYIELLKSDENVKYPHKEAWNTIILNFKG